MTVRHPPRYGSWQLVLIYYVYVIYYAGSLVPVNCAQAGLGGGVAVKIACSGCGLTIDYSSSAMLGGVHFHLPLFRWHYDLPHSFLGSGLQGIISFSSAPWACIPSPTRNSLPSSTMHIST